MLLDYGPALKLLANRLSGHHGFEVRVIAVRDLPPAAALVHAGLSDPQIVAAIEAIWAADGDIVGTPIYQTSFSGLLKLLLDLLPKQRWPRRWCYRWPPPGPAPTYSPLMTLFGRCTVCWEPNGSSPAGY